MVNETKVREFAEWTKTIEFPDDFNLLKAIDFVDSWFKELIDSKEYSYIDTLLSKMDIRASNNELLLCIVRITLPSKNLLLNRDSFVLKVKETIYARTNKVEGDLILKGIQ